jgi:hypothetical protein
MQHESSKNRRWSETITYHSSKKPCVLVPLPGRSATKIAKERIVFIEILHRFAKTDFAEAAGSTMFEYYGPVESAFTEHLTGLLESGILQFVTPVFLDKRSGLKQILTDEITVRVKHREMKSSIHRLAGSLGAKTESATDAREVLVKVPRAFGTEALMICDALDKLEQVQFAAPNFISEVSR